MPSRTNTLRGKALKKYSQNRNRLKGKLFELVLGVLLEKAGFTRDFESSQITKNRKRLHGRGATYDPDFFGVFKIGIPFVNPIMIIVEAKHYKSKVQLKNAREFLGSYYDFNQFVKIDTRKGGDKRYEAIYETRFNYSAILFSAAGFQKSAIGLMYAHGIGFISQENSKIIEKIFKLMEKVLDSIQLQNLSQADFNLFKSFETIQQLEKTHNGYDEAVAALTNFVNGIYSYIGVIDLKFPIQILGKRELPRRLPTRVKIRRINDENYRLQTSTNRIVGDFSFSDKFLEDYVKRAKKKGIEDKVLKTVDIVIPRGEVMEIRQFLIGDASRNSLINP